MLKGIEERRWKIVRASLVLLGDFFKTNRMAVRCTSGLPRNAKLIRVWPDPDSDTIRFLFESPEFDIIAEGSPIPYLEPLYSMHSVDVPERRPLPLELPGKYREATEK